MPIHWGFWICLHKLNKIKFMFSQYINNIKCNLTCRAKEYVFHGCLLVSFSQFAVLLKLGHQPQHLL